MNMHYRSGPRMSDVRDALENDAGKVSAKRRDMLSALNRLEALTGKPLNQIPAYPAALRDAFAEVQPFAHDITRKTLSNIKSLCLLCLEQSQMVPGVVRDAAQRRPRMREWAEICDAIPGATPKRNMSRLTSYCNDQGIAPEQVTSDVMEDMMAHIDLTSLRPDQYKIHRQTAIAWNKTVDRHPEKALQKVIVPPSRRRRCRVPIEQISASFMGDWNGYEAWAHGEDMFADDIRPVSLKRSTLDHYWEMIHQAVSLLNESGKSLADITSIADLTSSESFKAIMRKHVAKSTSLATIHLMARLLVQLASEWVKADEAEIARLKKWVKKLPKFEPGLTEKNAALLEKFEDPALKTRILKVPGRIWEEALSGRGPARDRLAAMQTGLGIEILIHIPVRIKNLAALTFDKHIFLRPGGTSTLTLRKHEVKTRKDLQFDIPPALAARLIDYRNVIAARFIGHSPDRLFSKIDGSPKGIQAIRHLIELHLKLHLGIHINPHAFRHIMAKFILDANPGAHAVVQHLLGHASLQTTLTFYSEVHTRRAGRHHSALMEEYLKEAEASEKSKRKARKPRKDKVE